MSEFRQTDPVDSLIAKAEQTELKDLGIDDTTTLYEQILGLVNEAGGKSLYRRLSVVRAMRSALVSEERSLLLEIEDSSSDHREIGRAALLDGPDEDDLDERVSDDEL